LAFSYAGSVAVVTGAASGIGAALSAALAARGADLALADRDAAGLRRVAEATAAAGRKVSQHAIDVADHAAVADLPRAILAAHGRVSILINNAGVALAGTFEEVRSEDFDWLMDVNFGGTVRMTRAFLPLLRREPDAALVNISSLFGLIAPPGQAAYAASKFAVRGFTEALRHELAGSSIQVACVHPGGVATAIARSARLSPGIDERSAGEMLALSERMLTMAPAEAAEIILRGVEAGDPRILVGKDAQRGDQLQRLFPRSYMRRAAKGLERKLRATTTQAPAERVDATPVAGKASLQAHAIDALIRLTVKRQMSRVRDPRVMRAAMEEKQAKLPEPALFSPAELGGVAGEWASWEGVAARATLLYLHGGGYFACSPRTHRVITSGFAKRGLSVFVPDYRLAPEHPFPAAIDDAVAVWRALRARAPHEPPPLVAGDSAGGGLVLALVLKLRAMGETLPSALVLFSPWTDLTVSGASIEGNAKRDAVFTPDGVRRGPSIYLAGADPRDPLASPVLADLQGLPPMLIHVGQREMLLDDSTRIAARARAAGVHAEVTVWPVVPHVWQMVPWLPEAVRSLDQAAAFLLAQPQPMRAAA
jgi:epsilon-lactone hydrolase